MTESGKSKKSHNYIFLVNELDLVIPKTDGTETVQVTPLMRTPASSA